jgi:hypothetical protein
LLLGQSAGSGNDKPPAMAHLLGAQLGEDATHILLAE